MVENVYLRRRVHNLISSLNVTGRGKHETVLKEDIEPSFKINALKVVGDSQLSMIFVYSTGVNSLGSNVYGICLPFSDCMTYAAFSRAFRFARWRASRV